MRATHCLHCGAEFDGGRVDRLYCNQACSKAFRRAREAAERGKYWVSGHYRRRRVKA